MVSQVAFAFGSAFLLAYAAKQNYAKLEDEVYYVHAAAGGARKFYHGHWNYAGAEQHVALIASTLLMAAFMGMNQHVYRKHRRYLLAPQEDDVSNKFLSTIAEVSGCLGCIVTIILSCCTGFNQHFLATTHASVKELKYADSIDTLYSFMMTTAIIQGILPLLQAIYTFIRFQPVSVEQR